MKKTILTLVFVSIAIGASSQISEKLNFELRAGAGYSALGNLDYGHEQIIVPQGAFSVGYDLTESLEMALELSFFQHGYTNDNGASLNASYIGFPVLLKRTFPSGLFSFFGFEIAGNAAYEEKYEAIIEDNQFMNEFLEMNDAIFSIPVGIGYNFSKSWFIEARWNIGLSSIAENYDYTADLFSGSIGFRF